jgi:serine/threonine protein kinase
VTENPNPNDTSGDDQVQHILNECLAMEMGEWSQAVESACGEHPEHAGELRLRFEVLKSAGLVDDANEAADRPDATHGEDTFGGFQLLRVLGQGGMGVVHLARQLSTGREVALKLIRPEFLGQERARKRFQREIEAVSQLDDPGICTVYEAGEVAGTPYVAMRYVKGCTLAQAPESLFSSDGTSNATGSQASNKKRTENMLTMFEKIARALHAAHESGFLHRDVKPGNIMIDEQGEPVMLDFGLARPEDDTGEGLTASADQLGTPAYMSPEQVQGKASSLDRRTDVYSLGVTMYECLARKHPFAAPTREVLYQNILAGQAATLGRAVPRDVSVIVQTAMSLSPDHRYDSANAFADDLRRARLLEPIEARRPNSLERTMRWCQRQPLVAGLIAALLAIASVSAWLAIDANNSRIAAEQQRIAANNSRIAAEQQADTRGRVSRFLVDLFEVPNGNTYRGQTITAREVLDQGFREIQNGLTEEPAIRAQLMTTMGEVYSRLGMLARAVTLFEQARELHDQTDASPADAANLEANLGAIASNTQDYSTASKHYERALDILTSAGQGESIAVAQILELHANVYRYEGQFDAAKELLDRAHQIRERLGISDTDRIHYHELLSTLALFRGDKEIAKLEIEHAIELNEASITSSYPETRLQSSLGTVLLELGQIEAAKTAIDKTMSLLRESFGDDHPRMGITFSRLGQLATASKAFEDAARYHSEAHRLACKFHGPDSAAAATQLCMLGSLEIETGNLKKAKELLEDALAKRRKVFGNKGAPVGRCLLFLGEVEGIQRHHEAAIERFREAHTVLSEALGDSHPELQVPIQYMIMHLRAINSDEVKEWESKRK